MADQIKALVEGGKATAGPPLGPALGPLGVPIPKIIAAINEKTKAFAGMQVPVTVKVKKDRTFEVEVGTPPVSALVKKELNLEKASGSPKAEKVANMLIEQAIKVAKMKEAVLLTNSLKGAVKTVVGSCVSMGVLVEGKDAKEALKLIDQGVFDEKILSGKTELTAEELSRLEEQKLALAEATKKAREQAEKKANEIMEKMKGRERAEIKAALKEAGIPADIIQKLLPVETAAPAAGAEAAKPGAPAPAGGAGAAPKAEEKKPAAEKK